jgi:hypothetical protein
MREGKKEFYSYRYLSSRGFLPNYGFPSSNVTLSFYNLSDEFTRNEAIALSEFGPGNIVYYRGDSYRVTFAKPKREKRKPIREKLVVCENCSAAILGERATSMSACTRCGTQLSYPKDAIRIPDMLAIKVNRITSDEEERTRLGYDLSTHYDMGDTSYNYIILGNDGTSLEIKYEHNGRLVYLNKGTKKNEEEGQESGFTLCSACDKWL